MKRSTVIKFTGILSTIILALILSWSGYTFFSLEQRQVSEQVENIIQKTAARVQEKNRTLDNLLASYYDKDGSEKQAFAMGITGNTGKMQISFIDEEDEEASTPEDEHIMHITKDTLEQLGITVDHRSVKSVPFFDSLFADSIIADCLGINYIIVPQKQHGEFSFTADSSAQLYQYHSRPFIINYYEPDVFRVNYNIKAATILGNMWQYVLAAVFLLILVPAAFILYYRAYLLQVQAATFKETLFSNITHELKTPLSSLQLIIDAAQKDKNKLNTEKLSFASAELERMKLIVDKILSYGKLKEEEFSLNATITDIAMVITDAVSAMLIVGEQHNTLIEYHTAGQLKITGDRTLLVNMFTSLIDNAIKYNSNEQPYIIINAEKVDDNICITIADNGHGIPHEYHKRIFEPFFRVPSGDVHEIKGNGIGLSFVAQVVQLHGGAITVAANKPAGSIFTILLPI